MRFFARLPLADIIGLCRALRHQLDVGLTVQEVLRQQANRGSYRVKPVAARLYQTVKRGDDLSKAAEKERACFPPLFLSMIKVAESTGTLPEVFAALESYYTMQQRLLRNFLSKCTLPIINLVAAICIISLTIWVMSLVASMNNSEPMDPIGLGLTGAGGALTFFFGSFGIIAAIIGTYLFLNRFVEQKALVDAILLRVPAIGPALTALVLARFCMALRYTMETALPVDEALDLSMLATGNAYYRVKARRVVETIRSGDDLTTALTQTGLFSDEFLTVVATGEESGRLPDVMKHQAKYYEEEADRKLDVLAKVAGFGAWAFVALLIVIAIFRMAMQVLMPVQQMINQL